MRENVEEKCEQEFCNKTGEQEEKQLKRLGRVQFILVILMFAAVILITEVISVYAGKTAGTIGLVIIALAIALVLYRKEIVQRLRKNK